MNSNSSHSVSSSCLSRSRPGSARRARVVAEISHQVVQAGAQIAPLSDRVDWIETAALAKMEPVGKHGAESREAPLRSAPALRRAPADPDPPAGLLCTWRSATFSRAASPFPNVGPSGDHEVSGNGSPSTRSAFGSKSRCVSEICRFLHAAIGWTVHAEPFTPRET